VNKTTIDRQGRRQQEQRSSDWLWRFWLTVPLYPRSQRRTLRTEVVRETVWTFDQIQGIFYVVVPIRMTVVKLDGGGLLVYAPIAPTPECLRLVNELVAQYGDVKYIILPTISGVEHKGFCRSLCQTVSKRARLRRTTSMELSAESTVKLARIACQTDACSAR
jgi:hypothetical protein